MSKATRIRQQNARERIAAQRAAARHREIRNRVLVVGVSTLAVIAVVVALIVVKISGNNSSSGNTSTTGTALPASVSKNITTVPADTLNSVGIGSGYTASPVSSISDTALTSNGKPEMLYIGAEFCPYCAAERWSMAVALSRFGTFTTKLHGIHSSSSDTDPNTPTLTFYKSQYTSQYLVFTPVENEDISHGPLQATTAQQQALWVKYDTSNGEQGYPFIDFANKYVIKAPTYDPGVLAGLTWAQVATDLHNSASPAGKAVLGSANLITAAICKMTNGQPGSVCTSSGVVQASAHL
jgi:thiol-disulfide isomerase/thioredoxin